MFFVPLLLLERAPDPAPPDPAPTAAPAAASAELDVVTHTRGPAPPVQGKVDADLPAGDGLEATAPVAAGDPVVDAGAPAPAPVPVDVPAAPPPTEAGPTSTTTTSTTLLPPLDKVLASVRGRQQTGQASWYHFEDASCAHRSLPFGTIVTVTNLATGKQADCRVADRGPMAPERVIDLSYDVFGLIADPGTGVIDVGLQW